MSGQEPVLRPFLWLWVPLAVFVVQIFIELFLPQKYYTAFHTENGPIETVQMYILIIAVCVAVAGFLKVRNGPDLFIKMWFAVAALGCFYTAGEEISWGQHLFGWGTPEGWQEVNDQLETNLHNTSSWLDQKPRLILELGIITGGIFMQIVPRRWLAKLPRAVQNIVPPRVLMLTALLYLVVKVANHIGDVFGAVFFKRASEVNEYFMYYFVLLYLLSLVRKSGLSSEAPR
ncbi:MAG TPA: hypothetical protein VIG74_04665 [Alphaproteobacteria bacterium]